MLTTRTATVVLLFCFSAVRLLISAPSLGVYYFLSLTLSVCQSVCLSQTLILLFRFSTDTLMLVF